MLSRFLFLFFALAVWPLVGCSQKCGSSACITQFENEWASVLHPLDSLRLNKVDARDKARQEWQRAVAQSECSQEYIDSLSARAFQQLKKKKPQLPEAIEVKDFPDKRCASNACAKHMKSLLKQRKKKLFRETLELHFEKALYDQKLALLADAPCFTRSKSPFCSEGIVLLTEQDSATIPYNTQDTYTDIFCFRGKRYFIAHLNPDSFRLNLHVKTDSLPHHFKSYEKQLQKQGLSLYWMMNAGMYLRDQSPQGLCIKDGNLKAPLDTKDAGYGNFYSFPMSGSANGVFYQDTSGGVDIALMTTMQQKVDSGYISLATQSGPIMVWQDSINPAFNEGSSNLNIRNTIGVTPNGYLVVAISLDEVCFYDFSILLRDYFNCTKALYLDGVVSRVRSSEEKILELPTQSGHLGPILSISKPNDK